MNDKEDNRRDSGDVYPGAVEDRELVEALMLGLEQTVEVLGGQDRVRQAVFRQAGISDDMTPEEIAHSGVVLRRILVFSGTLLMPALGPAARVAASAIYTLGESGSPDSPLLESRAPRRRHDSLKRRRGVMLVQMIAGVMAKGPDSPRPEVRELAALLRGYYGGEAGVHGRIGVKHARALILDALWPHRLADGGAASRSGGVDPETFESAKGTYRGSLEPIEREMIKALFQFIAGKDEAEARRFRADRNSREAMQVQFDILALNSDDQAEILRELLVAEPWRPGGEGG